MNNSSQFILVSVPLEMFLEAGINTESIIQVSAREGFPAESLLHIYSELVWTFGKVVV